MTSMSGIASLASRSRNRPLFEGSSVSVRIRSTALRDRISRARITSYNVCYTKLLRVIPLQKRGERWEALFGVDVDTEPGTYPMYVVASLPTGHSYNLRVDLTVRGVQRPVERLTLPEGIVITSYSIHYTKLYEDLIYGAIDGMLATLDPHSAFMPPEEYAERKVDTLGAFGGLGIEVTVRDEILTVVSPIDDTPAYRAGIKAGDKILWIGDTSTKSMDILDAVRRNNFV